MSSPMKLSLLAFIATAAAVPHSGHSRFHKPHGSGNYGTGRPAYPTGGWHGSNSTAIAQPTGTGYPDESTTTIEETLTSTTTVISTIYATPSPVGEQPTEVGEADVSTGAGVCGPETITVTATNKVTVTITPGTPVYSVSASASAEASFPVFPTEAGKSPEWEAVLPSSSSSVVKEEEVTVSLPNKQPDYTPAPSSQEAPAVTTDVPAVTTDVPAVTTSTTPTSSTPPVTPSTPAYSGGKRGLAYNDANLCSSFAGKAAWAFNWGSAPSGDLPEGIKFIPLAWTKNETPEQWLKKVDEAVAAGSDVVMGFNEVDHPNQANMLPGVACGKWAEYMDPIAASHPDVTILGPSVTNAGDKANWGLDWYKNFQTVCPGAKYHAVTVHFYDIWQDGEGQAGTLGRFQAHIENAHKLTGKPVWVTEFGLNEGQSAADVTKFLQGAMKYMDGADIVAGYSYFMVGTGANQLSNGNGLSAIGEIYASS